MVHAGVDKNPYCQMDVITKHYYKKFVVLLVITMSPLVKVKDS